MAPSAVNLTPEERTAYAYLFAKADTEKIGVLVGEKAVAFFSHSKLPPTILGEIWQLADQDNAGFLTRPQFDIALRLIGKAQRGIPINSAAISTPGPLCRLEGFTIPGIAVPSSPLPSVSALPLAKTASSVQDPLYVIPESDKTKYVRMFINAGPNDGLLDGEKARDIFIKSQLSFEKLAQIWTLSDTQSRGSLSVGDFSIAMHLIQLCMSGRLATLPAQLPPGLMDSARSPVNPALVRALSPQMTGQPSHVLNHSTGSQRQATLNSSIRPQYTGQHASATMPPLASSSQSLSASATFPPQGQWDISPAELAQSNVFFEQLDPTRQGFITGDRAVPFMMESKLPGETLAQIWDLADIRGEGQLTREEFAVAMRLIQDTLAGASGSLPTQLPVSMIPPSLRRSGVPSATMLPVQASDTTNDLLSLMDDHDPTHATSPVTAMAPISAQNTGQSPQLSTLSAQRTGASVIGSMPSVLSPPASSTGMNSNTQAVPRQFTGQTNTLLTSLEDSGARLGNLHTQVASTENSLTQLRTEHGRLEADVGSNSAQIRTLETKLSTSRAAYQTESRLVQTLRAKQAEQRTVVKQLTEEVIRAESELSALKMEKSQIEGTVLRDKEDIRDMKKKMAELQEQTQQIRTALESLKKDARLQKGLVAITKKQVSTVEGQKDQASKELAGLQEAGIPGATENATTRSLTPVPSVTSPSESVSTITKSTNPFASMFLSKSPQPIEQSPPGSNFGQERAVPPANESDPFATSLESPPPKEQLYEENSKHAEHENPPAIGFDEAFAPNESKSTFIVPPISSPSLSAVRPTNNAPGSPSFQATQPRGDEDDLSSDEDEVEDATGSKLLSSSKTIKPQSSADLKFPPLSDGEFYTTGSDETHQSHRPSTLVQAGDAFYSARSGSFRGNFGSPGDTQHPENSNFDSILDSKSSLSPAKPSGFGDELDVSDFATDFGPEEGKATTATMEDFDSAFVNLPPPSKVTDKPTGAIGNGAGESQDSTLLFDDSFGDDFVIKSSTGAPGGFDDAFANFNDHFTPQPTQTLSIPNESNEVDPFGGSSTSSLPPHLPPRNNTEKNDQDLPRDDDDDAVKQICSMGFAREVAIEALKKDEGDVERALNHLLGV